jgi:hypothetical protein
VWRRESEREKGGGDSRRHMQPIIRCSLCSPPGSKDLDAEGGGRGIRGRAAAGSANGNASAYIRLLKRA